MVDSGGPGTHNLKACTTLGLADLGDTLEFDVPGEENQLYGFQLSEGTYKRKEISVSGGALKFGELSDVEVDNAEVNKPHQFILTNNDNWIPFRDPIQDGGGWHLDFKIEQPYVNLGKNHDLRKIQNSGKLLASCHTRKELIIKSTDFGYVVGIRGNKTGTLRLNKEFDFGQPADRATIILDILLGDVPDDFVDVIKGLKIKWSAQHANSPLRIFIRIPKNGEGSLLNFSLEGIAHQLPEKISYDFIHIGPTQFQRLRYTTIPLATTYLNKI